MRIAFVCYPRAFAVDGVNHKIARQTAAWRSAGHDVEVFALSAAPSVAGTPPALHAHIFVFDSFSERIRQTIATARAVRRFRPDIVYLRYDRYVPPLPPLLWPLRMAFEVNTDDTLETVFWGRSHWIYNEVNRRVSLPLATGLICVTYELASADTFTRFRKPTAVIANGGDAADVAAVPSAPGPRPSAVMLVGSVGPWVGLDKAVRFARAHPDVDVQVVGCDAASLGLPAPPNLTTHGLMSRSEYRSLLAGADFGIGPLAVHRKGMDEASPLKVREYLLHGLPVLIAHRDTDFLDAEPWYLLRLPNVEDNVEQSVDRVRAWAQSVRGRRVPHATVVRRIGMAAKEETRLTFLTALAGHGYQRGEAQEAYT
jgi:hypothetical protein